MLHCGVLTLGVLLLIVFILGGIGSIVLYFFIKDYREEKKLKDEGYLE